VADQERRRTVTGCARIGGEPIEHELCVVEQGVGMCQHRAPPARLPEAAMVIAANDNARIVQYFRDMRIAA
jgi:hypothetical protein